METQCTIVQRLDWRKLNNGSKLTLQSTVGENPQKSIILQFQRKPVGLNSYVNAIYPKLLPISTKSLQNETI